MRVGVIGAGVMGAQIAALAAKKGITVYMRDIKQSFVDRGLKVVRDSFENKVTHTYTYTPHKHAHTAHTHTHAHTQVALIPPCSSSRETERKSQSTLTRSPEELHNSASA